MSRPDPDVERLDPALLSALQARIADREGAVPDVDDLVAALGFAPPVAAFVLRSSGRGPVRPPGPGPWTVVHLDDGPGGDLREPLTGASRPAIAGAVHHDLVGSWIIGAGRAGVRRSVWLRRDGPGLVVLRGARVPDTTLDALRRGAAANGVPIRVLSAADLDPWAPPLDPGWGLYNASADEDAGEAEQQLWQPGVGSFHLDGPYVSRPGTLRALARAGVTVPRSAPARPGDLPRLNRIIDALGGFPVVVKIGGGEGGIGTLRADSMPALRGLLDLAWSRGDLPRLLAWIPDAMHWRVIVLNGRALTAYRNPVRDEDFRSAPSGEAEDYGLEAPADVADLAVRAAEASGVAFGGADVLVHPSGRAYVLEVNFPCYFPSAESFDRADVAGPLVAALMRRATHSNP